MHCSAIREAGIFPPSDSLSGRELSRSLALEKDEGFGEGVSVVVGGGAGVAVVGGGAAFGIAVRGEQKGEREEKEKGGKRGHFGKHHTSPKKKASNLTGKAAGEGKEQSRHSSLSFSLWYL